MPYQQRGSGCLNRFSASISGASAGLGCQAERQRREVGVIGCYAVKARVWTSAIIKVQIAANRSAGFADAVVGPQIHLLVFDAAPKPLDEHVVPPSPLAVHADGDPVLDQHTSERGTGELAALIRVDDLGLAIAGESVLKCLDAECRLLLTRAEGLGCAIGQIPKRDRRMASPPSSAQQPMDHVF